VHPAADLADLREALRLLPAAVRLPADPRPAAVPLAAPRPVQKIHRSPMDRFPP